MAQCTFIKKDGNQCGRHAKRGQNCCCTHGKGGRPVQSGRYSKVLHRRVGDLIARHGEDENPLDMLPELALLRALTEDYINRYDVMTEALLAWHNDGKKPDAKPPRILDLADSYRLISETTKIIKRVEDVKANNAISQQDFFRLTEQMGLAVKLHVKDEKTRDAISKDWNTLKF